MQTPKPFQLSTLLAALAALALLAAACGGGGGSSTNPDDNGANGGDNSDNTPASDDCSDLVMGRGNWSTGYFQAALVRELVQRLGCEVTDPAEKELAPSLAYLALAQDEIDFWANGWDPLHNGWLANERPDGSLISEHVSAVGSLIPNGALQGYFITKSFADEFNIETLDDLNNSPAAIAEYDKYDHTPGNGIAEIYGCEESWTCDDVIASQIVFSQWDNIAQVLAGYDAMFAAARRNLENDHPTVVYSWTPSAYLTVLEPGTKTLWLGVENTLDDSNPLDRPGGEGWDQRPGIADLGAENCAKTTDDDRCVLGFAPGSIRIYANNDTLASNPKLAKLLQVIELDLIDVSLQIVAQDNTEDTPEDLAAKWLENNADKADDWLAAARSAT